MIIPALSQKEVLAAIYFDGVLLRRRWAGSKLAAGPESGKVDLVRLLW